MATGLFEHTQQRFLVSGHSFLPHDANFSLIKRRKTVTEAFVPYDLHKIVRASKVLKPFETALMFPSDFLNIQTVADEVIHTKGLNISKVVSITYATTDVSRVGVKESFRSTEVCKKIRVLKKGYGMNDMCAAQFEAVPSEHSITEEKKKQDLKGMVPYLAQDKQKVFYMDICSDNV